MKNIENAIRKFVKEETGIELMACNEALKLDKSVVLFTDIKISPKDAGALSPMFKIINFSITALTYVLPPEDIDAGQMGCDFELMYSYQHPSGSNGYACEYVTNGNVVMSRYDFFNAKYRFPIQGI